MGKIEEIYGSNQSKFFFKNLHIARKKHHEMIIPYISDEDEILDIGTTPILDKHENFFLNHYKFPDKITCFSDQNLDKLKTNFPNLKTIQGDGRSTNLPDRSYDIVISNATLEHVGNYQNQCKFIKELYRLSKKRCIISTPNRYFPIDSHTMLPLIHWLPKKIHRRVLNLLNQSFLAKEENLNLMSTKDITEICGMCNLTNFKILKMKYYLLTSNLILILEKNK